MELNIANNIRTIELLKTELLQRLADIYGEISAEPDGENLSRLTACFAGLINTAYLTAMRLGIEPSELHDEMCGKLADEIKNEHIIERRYGDLSRLYKELKQV